MDLTPIQGMPPSGPSSDAVSALVAYGAVRAVVAIALAGAPMEEAAPTLTTHAADDAGDQVTAVAAGLSDADLLTT